MWQLEELGFGYPITGHVEAGVSRDLRLQIEKLATQQWSTATLKTFRSVTVAPRVRRLRGQHGKLKLSGALE